mgnify:CR=1 FL=1
MWKVSSWLSYLGRGTSRRSGGKRCFGAGCDSHFKTFSPFFLHYLLFSANHSGTLYNRIKSGGICYVERI